jgi:hypothetical protein
MDTTKPRRLLVMSCSATKTTTPGSVPARQRYDGPLFQSYRKIDPTGQHAVLTVLSAELGWIHGDQPIQSYERRMSAERGDELVDRGLTVGPFDYRHLDIPPAARWLRDATRSGPFTEVCIVGGKDYQGVALELVDQARCPVMDRWLGTTWAPIAPTAKVIRICNQIGVMRQQLRHWLLGEAAWSTPEPWSRIAKQAQQVAA